MGDVRIVDRQFGGARNDGATAVAEDGWPEACARHEVRSIRVLLYMVRAVTVLEEIT